MRIFQQCSNAIGWSVISVPSRSDPERVHQVAISDWGHLCDCEGFRYRGACRHQSEAEANRCRWQEGDLPSQSDAEKVLNVCPNCGDPTILVAEVEDGE